MTPTHRGRVIGGDDVRAQTHFALDRAEGALQSLDAEMAHTVRVEARTREEDWPDVLAVLRERLPSTTNVARAPGQASHPHHIEIDVEART